jgi:hypothetical protein
MATTVYEPLVLTNPRLGVDGHEEQEVLLQGSAPFGREEIRGSSRVEVEVEREVEREMIEGEAEKEVLLRRQEGWMR